jgi:hypothetical protein
MVVRESNEFPSTQDAASCSGKDFKSNQPFFPVPKYNYMFERLPEDLLVQCPRCKTMETVCIKDEALVNTRKFHISDGKIFHDCGSVKPCFLHRF